MWHLRIFALVAALALGWYFARPAGPAPLAAERVRRVEVELHRWDKPAPPPVATEDRAAIAELLAVVRGAEVTTDHKCGHRGTVAVEPLEGDVLRLEFLPGHDKDWYEFRTGRKIYRVRRAAFVKALRRIGVEVPLEC